MSERLIKGYGTVFSDLMTIILVLDHPKSLEIETTSEAYNYLSKNLSKEILALLSRIIYILDADNLLFALNFMRTYLSILGELYRQAING